jgi:hypothetical protein
VFGNLDCNGRRRDAFDCYVVDAGAICNSSPLLKATADDRPQFRFRFGVEWGLVIGGTVSSFALEVSVGSAGYSSVFIVVLRCSSGFFGK